MALGTVSGGWVSLRMENVDVALSTEQREALSLHEPADDHVEVLCRNCYCNLLVDVAITTLLVFFTC